MRAVSSLTNRVFLACTLLASLSLGFAFYFVNERASSDAEADLRRGLLEAGTLVDQYGATRVDHFMRLARVVADLPKLKAAVETGDPPTVQPLADQYRTEVGADLIVLTGRRGALLGAAGADEATIAAAVEDTPSLDEISTFTPHARGVLQLVSVPILLEGEIPDILGRFTVGVFLDDRVANDVKALTGSEIAFGAQGRVLASTLPNDARGVLEPAMRSASVGSVAIGDEEFVTLARPLVPGDDTTGESGVALILRSRTARLQFLSAIRTGLA